jgi:hypothetical protein
MRKHPEIGAHILEGKDLTDVRQWILEHHERPDGRGYPYGLGAEQVPLEAKIIAVADAFEAMTSDRVYRHGMGVATACERLRAGAGTQWDLHVVEAMLRLVERRDLLVFTSLSLGGETAADIGTTTDGQGGQGGGYGPAEGALNQSGAAAIERRRGAIVVRGRLAGRDVEAVWDAGRVSGDPIIVTMVEQLVLSHRLDVSDPWNFLLLMSAAVDQGTLDADGDIPQADLLESA